MSGRLLIDSGPALDREHREAFWEFVLTEAEPWHREHLQRLFREWEGHNGAYFEERLIPPIILLAEPPAPGVFGCCAAIGGHGAHSEIRLRPSLLTGTHPRIDESAPREGRYRFVSDVLLHETIHQWHQEVTGIDECGYHGHGPAFRDVCNRIGEALGLPPVRSMKKRGPDAELPSCAQWPHNVRPDGFYLGAYRPVPANGDIVGARLRSLVDQYGYAHVAQTLVALRADRKAPGRP